MAFTKKTQDAPPPADPQPSADVAELAEVPETDTELAEANQEPMVTYHGPFGLREITAEQWAAAGIEGMPTVQWQRRTGFKVPKSVFTEQALQVLRQDQGFRVP